jgi:16S rRNA (uracil1498-N3)-methyltransferase
LRVFVLPGQPPAKPAAPQQAGCAPQEAGCSPGRGVVELRGRDYHYLVRVLRLAPGERFPARDAGGGLRSCRVAAVGPDFVRLELDPPEPEEAGGPPLALIQALPKGRKMDQIVRQVTEAGVAEILPVFSRFSLSRLEEPRDRVRRVERWRRIAREATQQSGGSRVPLVGEPVPLERALGREAEEGELRLVFHQSRLSSGSLHAALAAGPRRVTLLVGPEGGLAEEELARALECGFRPITIGRRVWRTETAALFAAAVVQCLLEEREAWKPA